MNKPRIVQVLGSLLLVAGFCASPAFSESLGAYHLLSATTVSGDGGWDYLTLDAAARRLYVAHSDSIQVLDADHLNVLGTRPNVLHPHGIALVPELGKGYASSGDPGDVIVFDLKSLKRLGQIKTSKDCDGILYDPASRKVWTFNGDSANATEIDPKLDTVTGTLDLGGDPEAAVADGHGLIYDNLVDKGEILTIDSLTNSITARWVLPDKSSPTGLALDQAHQHLFVGSRNKSLMILDTASGKVLESLPIGEHVDTTNFNPLSNRVFDSCGDGTLSVVQGDAKGNYAVLENFKTMLGARTMCLDASKNHIYSDCAETEPLNPPDPQHPQKRKILPGTFKVLLYGEE